MTFDFSLLPFKKEGREKENEVAKIVIKSHAYLLDPLKKSLQVFNSRNGNFILFKLV